MVYFVRPVQLWESPIGPRAFVGAWDPPYSPANCVTFLGRFKVSRPGNGYCFNEILQFTETWDSRIHIRLRPL
jgi:hypothetical protein